jgi:hypothetical protein
VRAAVRDRDLFAAGFRVKTVARAAALAAVLLAVVAARVVWSSRAEWRAAMASTGEERIQHLGRAARLYAPGNPYARRALAELEQTGLVQTGTGAHSPLALAAWREIRSAILATRSFYTPHRELLDEANAQIAELMAQAEDPARGPPAARRAWHAARLQHDDAPSVGWSLAALVGLALWIGSAVAFFLRGLDERDKLRRRPALACALGVALGLILFFVGLARA